MITDDDDGPTADLLKLVPERALVRVSVGGRLDHQCPHVDEADEGQVQIEWTCRSGSTVELHSLRAYLDQFAGVKISHEALTERIADDLADLTMISDVSVVSHWATAGLSVHVRAAGAMDDKRVRFG